MDSFCKRLGFWMWLLLSGSAALGQEICNNGKDDDGDGLVDLRDSLDCKCSSFRAAFIPSLIPNPSFEEKIGCPDDASQMTYAVGWIQGTSATTDYLNTCGFSYEAGKAGLLPFPDGQAAVGCFVSRNYKEYAAVCLSTPLIANKKYKIRFHVAASMVNPAREFTGCPLSINGIFDTINIAIFGSKKCSLFPISTNICPIGGDDSYQDMGSVLYQPFQKWMEVTIDFTPNENMKSLMIGAACLIPESYDSASLVPGCMTYLYFDNFVLNEEKFFEDKISVSTNGCGKPSILQSVVNFPVSSQAENQWFKNGIALVGTKEDNLVLSGSEADLGQYQIMVSDSGRCTISDTLSPKLNSVSAVISIPYETNVLVGSTIQFDDSSMGGLSRKWILPDGSFSTGKNINIFISDTGKYCVQLRVKGKFCSDSVLKCIQIEPRPALFIPNLFTPNGDSDNEVFRVKSNGLKSLECTIFNRWGSKMYNWNGVNGGWDGTFSGKIATAGNYFFILKYTDIQDQSKTVNGWLNLSR